MYVYCVVFVLTISTRSGHLASQPFTDHFQQEYTYKLVLKFLCYTHAARLVLLYLWASSRQNLSSGFPTKRVSNQPPQQQRLARNLKFHL